MTSAMDFASHDLGMPWLDGAAAFGVPGGWYPGCSADVSKFPMPFLGAMSQMPIHNYPTTKIPPGVEQDDHEVCHRKGLEAYQDIYQQTMEERLEFKKARQEKEKKEAKKAAAAGAKEPIRIDVTPSTFQQQAKQPAPPPNAPIALPSKPSLPDPPTHDANRGKVLVGPPPGLEPPPGLVAFTWPLAPAIAKMPASSAVVMGPAMQKLSKTLDGTIPFQWRLDSRKLHSSDKVCVSPTFEYDDAKFKIMILAKAVNDRTGGSSFKKAKGQAVLEVKCVANPPKKGVKLRIAVTDRLDAKLLTATMPGIVHNFSDANICTMEGPEMDGQWELPFEKAEATFIVKLEVYDEDDDSKGIEEVKERKSVSWPSACCEEVPMF